MNGGDLQGKVVIVTGAAGGIGRALVRAFVERGLRVGASDVDAGGLAALQAEFRGERVLAVRADVSSYSSCADSVDRVAAHFGGLHMLVNNAGLGMGLVREDHFSRTIQIEDIDPAIWQKVVAVNLTGAFFMAHLCVPKFRAQRYGRIINVTTSFFTMLNPGFSPYGPAKSGLEAWSASSRGRAERQRHHGQRRGARGTDRHPDGARLQRHSARADDPSGANGASDAASVLRSGLGCDWAALRRGPLESGAAAGTRGHDVGRAGRLAESRQKSGLAGEGARPVRAVVCEEFGGPERLRLRDLPDPPTPGEAEVQVRITARGVQYTDVLMTAGKYQTKKEPPFIPGSEAAGEIVAVGPSVARFRVGDRVMARPPSGAFAELANCREDACDPVPACMSIEEAAVFRGGYTTAYYALLQRGRMRAGEWVLIHGAAGGIGLAAIQIAKLFGAKVIATAASEEKRRVCLEQGADHAIDYRGKFRDTVKDLTGGRGVDIVYDPLGADVFDESTRCLAPWGARLLILGFLAGPPALAKTNHLLVKGADALGVWIGGLGMNEPAQAEANMRELLRLAGEGKLRPYISHRFPLERAADAVQAVIDRAIIGKGVITG